MTTPYKGVSGGIKDAFNFYHSQLRINIECAFGMLVHKWGCLQKPLPCNFSLPKICALVKCLCILHSFCIDERLRRKVVISGDSINNDGETDCHAVLVNDVSSIVLEGGNQRGRLDDTDCNFDATMDRENELLDVGHHYNDCPNHRNKMEMALPQILVEQMPRDLMVNQLAMLNYTSRPRAMGTTTTNSV